MQIVSVKMVDAAKRAGYTDHREESARVILGYKVRGYAQDHAVGIAGVCADDLWCYGSNRASRGCPCRVLARGSTVEVLLMRADVLAGTDYLEIVVQARDGYVNDYHHGFYPFISKSEPQHIGVFRIPLVGQVSRRRRARVNTPTPLKQAGHWAAHHRSRCSLPTKEGTGHEKGTDYGHYWARWVLFGGIAPRERLRGLWHGKAI